VRKPGFLTLGTIVTFGWLFFEILANFLLPICDAPKLFLTL